MVFRTVTLAVLMVAIAAVGGPSFAAKDGPRKDGDWHKRILEKYDANKDGKLDAAEKEAMKEARAERRARMLEKYDANKDGKLDDSEKEAMREAFVDRLIKRLDKNDDGKMSVDEVPERHRGSFDKTDTNDDGYVDREELKVAMAKMHKRHKKCPAKDEGQGK